MPKYPEVGFEQECIDFSAGTDGETDGWWYHGTTKVVARQFLERKRVLDSKQPLSFTTDKNGASQNALADAVIRARIKANRPLDWYSTEDSDGNGLVGAGHRWLHIRDANCIMFDYGYCVEADAGDSSV